MVEKAKAPAKKTTVAKKTAPEKAATAAKKSPAKRKMNKGDSLVCEVCGLGVVVDEISGYVEESALICCGEAMKPKAKKTSPAKK